MILGRGSSLIGGTIRSELTRGEIEQILAEEDGVVSPGADASRRHHSTYGAQMAQGAADTLRPYARVRPDDVEHILEALKLNHGNKTRAAKILGIRKS